MCKENDVVYIIVNDKVVSGIMMGGRWVKHHAYPEQKEQGFRIDYFSDIYTNKVDALKGLIKLYEDNISYYKSKLKERAEKYALSKNEYEKMERKLALLNIKLNDGGM